MRTIQKKAGDALRLLAFASVSTLALSSQSTASAAATTTATTTATAAVQTTSASTVIRPLYGTIGAFYGQVGAFYGQVGAFYGQVGAFYGNIAPFYGQVGAFYGQVGAFYGGVSPFTQTTDANLRAFYGTTTDAFWGGGNNNPYLHSPSNKIAYSQIAPFWNSTEASWLSIQTLWNSAKTSADYATVASMLQTKIISPIVSFWGPAVAAGGPVAIGPAAPGAAPGKGAAAVSITSLISSEFSKQLSSSGLVIRADGTIDPNSLAGVTPTQQAVLFQSLYDNLMSYAGVGHVDWWMGATGWTPALAMTAGSTLHGSNPITVGMLDFTVTSNIKNAKGSLLQLGSSEFNDGHGAAVGSLIAGSIDGSQIMGVLPAGAANVIVYDPYDATGTTNWADIGTGIQALSVAVFGKGGSAAPVGVLNASLGVPGWTLNPGWNTALASGAAKGHNLVIAAGNDGSTQTTNVPWNFAVNPNLIIVGSVGVDGTISNFSNRPGEACLLDTASTSTTCVEANKLKYRFITAPGELVLVSDGMGGVTRQTGTSLAAPLVSGAIGLLQARWPWLASYPNETAQIILKSATPKGTNPGADAIYGVGELNIAASQAPLDWSKLTYYSVAKGVKTPTPLSASSLATQVKSGSQASWNSSGLYYTALETVGNTHRDFQIPMASTLVGQEVATEAGQQLFQSYLSTNLRSWASSHLVDDDRPAARAISGFMQSSVPAGQVGDMEVRLSMAPNTPTLGYKQSNVGFKTEMALIGRNQSLRFGYGDGAAAVDGGAAFGQTDDYRLDRGGANPLLGLASGGTFVDWRTGLTGGLSLNVGVTQRRDVRDMNLFGVANQGLPSANYTANAEHFGLDYAPLRGLTLHASMTRLREDSGLLGVQSLDVSALQSGSTTVGRSLGFDWLLSNDLTLSGSATVAKTRTGADQALHTVGDGLVSSSGEMALTKYGVLNGEDRVKLTLSKPMQVTGGQLAYSSYGVVDRQTGELGVIDQTAQVGTSRLPVSAQMLYGRVLPRKLGEVSFFVQGGANNNSLSGGPATEYLAGGKYRLAF